MAAMKVFHISGGPESARVSCQISEYGATILELSVPDRDGNIDDILLGYQNSETYAEVGTETVYFGSTVGRFAGRLKDAKLACNGSVYDLQANNGTCCLHGGTDGFHAKQWGLVDASSSRIKLSYDSPRNEGGFPSSVRCEVSYAIEEYNGLPSLLIEMTAANTGDLGTAANLTNHAYFNLLGVENLKRCSQCCAVGEHVLELSSEQYYPLDAHMIPLDCGPVSIPSPLSFPVGEKKTLGTVLQATEQATLDQVELVNGGIDHPFMLLENGNKVDGLNFAARLEERRTGRVMEVYTNQPVVVVYTGNYLHEHPYVGKHGRKFNKHDGVCLETQMVPNDPNRASDRKSLLGIGETSVFRTRYVFGTVKKS